MITGSQTFLKSCQSCLFRWSLGISRFFAAALNAKTAKPKTPTLDVPIVQMHQPTETQSLALPQSAELANHCAHQTLSRDPSA